jgi:hypothetical protein
MLSPSQVLRPKNSRPSFDGVNIPPQNSGYVLTLAILTSAAAAMTALLALLPAAGHDQMWCLYVAQQMLRGTTLYGPHLLESNPPLIMWMLLLPSSAARFLHLPQSVVFKLFVLATEAAIAVASLHLLRRFQTAPTKTRLWALAFAFVCIFGALPARDFGQRDHLLVLLVLPYVLAAALDAESSPGRSPVMLWTGIAIGIVAGVGISLKPHHLLVPAAVEAVLLLKRSNPRNPLRAALRPEPLALLATCAVYLAAIHLLTPLYLTNILPILRDTYWAIGHLTFLQLINESIELHILAAAALSLSFIAGWRKVRPLNMFLLVAGAASTVAYYLQGTGWYYQQIPALSFFSLALCLELLDFAEHRHVKLPTWAPKGAITLSVAAIVLTAYFSGYSFVRPFTFPSGLSGIPDPSFFHGLSLGTPVSIMTTVVDDSVPPIFANHLLLAQRENNLWTLPAILRNESPNAPGEPGRVIPPQRLAELDRLQHTWMVEDLAYWHPAIILVERCQDPIVHCQVLEDRHDDLLAWFLRDPDFRNIFAQYHYLRSSGPYDAYVPN